MAFLPSPKGNGFPRLVIFMNITTRNLNRVIRGETSSISFKYIEELCKYLECTVDELIDIEKDA